MIRPTIYATAQDAEAAFYEAIEKGDLEAMMTVWADDEEIVCIHPGGERLSGLTQIRDSWGQIFAGGQRLSFRLRRPLVFNGISLAVHSHYELISITGESRTVSPVVATNVYMRTGNGWRLVLHHASPAPAGPEPRNQPRGRPNTLH